MLFSFCLVREASSQNYIFAQLQGTPLNTAGWTMQGSASVSNLVDSGNSELVVCPAILNSSGAIFYNQQINLSKCNRWKAEFDFRIFDGTGADGLAFCFLDTPPVGFVTGSGLGIPGSANGLKVCFDTWNNCIPYDTNTVHQSMPKIEIRWGVGYNSGSDPNNEISGECLTSMPTLANTNGALSFLRAANYNHALISYDSGFIQVYVNNVMYLSGYQQFNFAGYLGFTASTGGYTDNHSIKNVVIYTEMPPSFAGNNTSVCPNGTIQIGGPSNPSYAYNWSPATGLSNTAIANPTISLSNDSDRYQLHTYYVRTSFLNRDGCASEDSIIIKVKAAPIVNFITPKICLSDAVGQFYDSSYTADSATLPFQYIWNFGDGNAQPSNPDNSILPNPTHHYSAAGYYTVGLKVTNSEGCVDSALKTFTVNGALPVANFNINSNTGICSNEPVPITNLSTVDFGSIVDVKIFWGDRAGISQNDSLPYSGKTYSHHYPNPAGAVDTNYTIHMIASSGLTCTNEMDKQVTIMPSPQIRFNPVPPVCSYAAPLYITEAVETSTLPGRFTFYGNGITAEGLLSPMLISPGFDTVQYKYFASNGCIDSAMQVLTIQAPPTVSAGGDTSIVMGEPLQLNALSSDITGDDFSWSPALGLNNASIANPVAVLGSGYDSVLYTVTATDTAGCAGQATKRVKIFKTLPDIFMPNAFTPGATINSVFRPILVGISSLDYFRVYNRWGQLVYSTSKIGAGWDGTISGIPQQTATYVWMVQGIAYTGQTVSKQGTVVLVK